MDGGELAGVLMHGPLIRGRTAFEQGGRHFADERYNERRAIRQHVDENLRIAHDRLFP